MLLKTAQDDFTLRANADLPRSEESSYFLFPYYLTDELGNKMTDESGNYLIGYEASVVFAQTLHALPDDLHLTSE